jgi:hypothetical protein
MLLCGCPEPATSKEWHVRQQLKALLEVTVAQQATHQSGLRRRQSKAFLGPIATSGTPSKPVGELTASTTTTTTARTTTMTVGAGGATTVTTTASAAGHRTSSVPGLLAEASVTRSSPRAIGLQPTCQGTMGTPTLVYGSRTTGSCAMPVVRPTISS